MINLYDVWWQLFYTNVCLFVHPILTIKLEFMYIIIRGNSFAPVSTNLQLDIAAILSG